MLLRRRGVLIAVGLVALATVSLAATLEAIFFRLPDPDTADGPGLIRWLVISDLTQETPELRRKLLVRLESELGGEKLGGGDINEQLEPQYRERFWSNVEVLLADWFQLQASRYAATPPAEQPAMIDRLLSEAQSLSQFQPPAAAATGGSSAAPKATDPISSAKALLEQMNKWVASAPAETRPQVRQFATAIQTAIAKRALQGFINALGGGAK